MHVVLLYAGLLALLFVALSLRTLLMRRRLHIAVGDGGNPALLRAMRVHANFAEYVPLALVLISLVEATGARPLYVHLLGAAVLAGRVSHAIGVSRISEVYAYRVFGMAMTFTPLIAAALRLLYVYVIQAAA
jgi:uncharacterized membrane protein YecN with MAPEG domain